MRMSIVGAVGLQLDMSDVVFAKEKCGNKHGFYKDV
jgi:hypothetical protein